MKNPFDDRDDIDKRLERRRKALRRHSEELRRGARRKAELQAFERAVRESGGPLAHGDFLRRVAEAQTARDARKERKVA